MATLNDLISAGHIHPGEKIEWHRPRLNLLQEAEITQSGLIRTIDGAIHKTPSGAARHYYQKPIDGWSAWKLIRNGESLAQIRKQLS